MKIYIGIGDLPKKILAPLGSVHHASHKYGALLFTRFPLLNKHLMLRSHKAEMLVLVLFELSTLSSILSFSSSRFKGSSCSRWICGGKRKLPYVIQYVFHVYLRYSEELLLSKLLSIMSFSLSRFKGSSCSGWISGGPLELPLCQIKYEGKIP